MAFAGPFGKQNNFPFAVPTATNEETAANIARVDAERMARAERTRARMIEAGTWTEQDEAEHQAEKAG